GHRNSLRARPRTGCPAAGFGCHCRSRSRWRPVHAGAPGTRSPAGSAATASWRALQHPRGDAAVIKRMSNAGDFLIRLMSLASDQHGIAGLRLADGARDGGSAVPLHLHSAAVTETGEDVGNDGVAILGAG